MVIFAAVGAAGFELYGLEARRAELGIRDKKAAMEASELLVEQEKLKNELAFLNDPERLLREARAEFNYARPGEKLIIVVPKKP